MKTDSLRRFRRLVLAGLTALTLAAGASHAHAAYVLTLQQVGTSVVITGAGSINTTALSLIGTSTETVGEFSTGYAYIAIGATPTAYSGVTGPGTFGSTNTTIYNATSSTGSNAGIYSAGNVVYTPASYVSGTAFTGTSTYANQTFATLGFTAGTYTYTWGTGTTADSLIVTSVVPEPSTWALLGVGVAGLGVVTLRQRHRIV